MAKNLKPINKVALTDEQLQLDIASISRNKYPDAPGAGIAKVRAVTPYFDTNLNAEKLIISLDATTPSRFALAIADLKERMMNGIAIDSITNKPARFKAHNLSFNVLQQFNGGGYGKRFVPQVGSMIEIHIGQITNKAGVSSYGVTNISPVPLQSATRISKQDIEAAMQAKSVTEDAAVEVA